MVRIDHKRSRIVIRIGSKKFEKTIETRYWRNPLLGIALLALLPVAFSWQPDILSLITTANIYACIAIPLSWQLTGIGRLNFGPQVFVGIGGFSAALMSVHFGWGPISTLPLTIIIALIFALIFSPLTNIAKGLYFSLITLILPLIFLQITFYFSIFKGETGLSGISPLIEVFNIKVEYLICSYLSLILLSIFLFIVVQIFDSRVGLYAAAINDDEEVAANLGLDIKKWKIICFVATSIMIAVTGWFAAHYFGTFSGITYLSLPFMLKILLIVMIGGRGDVYGAIYGAYFVVILERILTVLGTINYILFPVILAILLYTLPEGLYGIYRKHRYREYYPTIKVRRR